MADSCPRHIYNKSYYAWVFWATNDYGNVWFTGCANGASENGPCAIRLLQTIDIKYTYTGGRTLGRMYIKDSQNVTKDFEYGGIASRCPVVMHEGDTGSVVLNGRADGDFTIIAPTWAVNSCPSCQ